MHVYSEQISTSVYTRHVCNANQIRYFVAENVTLGSIKEREKVSSE